MFFKVTKTELFYILTFTLAWLTITYVRCVFVSFEGVHHCVCVFEGVCVCVCVCVDCVCVCLTLCVFEGVCV